MSEFSTGSLDYPFIGRKTFLKTLEDNWQHYRIIGVYGIRSVGKSRTAMEFIKLLTQQKQNGGQKIKLVQVDLSQIKTLRQLEIVLLSRYGIILDSKYDLENSLSESLVKISTHLNSTESEHIVLFDNAEDVVEGSFCDSFLVACATLIKSCANLHIFITSTTRVHFTQLRQVYLSMELKGMSREEGLELLYTVTRTMTPTGNVREDMENRLLLEKIVDLCTGLPLVLLMAASELDEDFGLLTPKDMVTLLMESRLQALSREFYPEEDRIANVYQKFIQRLNGVFQQRLAIMNYIPGTFNTTHVKKILDHSTETETKDQTLIPVRRRHMLQYDPSTKRFDIHGILRDCLSVYVSIQNLPAVRKRYCEMFANVMKDISEQIDTPEYTQAVIQFSMEHPNLQKLLTEVLYSSMDTYGVFIELARSCSFVISRFMGTESVRFYESCLKLTDQYGRQLDKAVVQLAYGKTITENLTDFSTAEQNFRQAILILEMQHVPRQLAEAYQSFGWNLYVQGRAVEALGFLKQAFQIEMDLHMDQEQLVLTTLICLGVVNNFIGNFEDGKKYNLESLKQQRKKLGTDEHPSVGVCYNNLGVTCSQMGEHKEALHYYSVGLEIKRKVGAVEKSIAISLNNVAMKYADLGNFQKAIELLDEAKSLLEKNPGLHLPIMTLTMMSYGTVFVHQMKYKEAVCYLEQAVTMYKTNQPNHICLVESLMYLAQAYFRLESFADVIKSIEESLSYQEKAVREMPQNIFIFQCLELLIDTYMKTCNHSQLHTAYDHAVVEINRLILVFASRCNRPKTHELQQKLVDMTHKVRKWCKEHCPDCVHTTQKKSTSEHTEVGRMEGQFSQLYDRSKIIQERVQTKKEESETTLEREDPALAEKIKYAIAMDRLSGKMSEKLSSNSNQLYFTAKELVPLNVQNEECECYRSNETVEQAESSTGYSVTSVVDGSSTDGETDVLKSSNVQQVSEPVLIHNHSQEGQVEKCDSVESKTSFDKDVSPGDKVGIGKVVSGFKKLVFSVTSMFGNTTSPTEEEDIDTQFVQPSMI